MKRILLLLILSLTFSISAKDKLTLHFFGESTCGECFKLKSEILLPMLDKHRDSLEIVFHDIDDTTGFKEFYAMNKAYGIEDDRPQELFFPDTVLKGFDEIDRKGKKLILHYLNNKELWTKHPLSDTTVSERPRLLTLYYIDNINPNEIYDSAYHTNKTLMFIQSLEKKHKNKDIKIMYFSNSNTKELEPTIELLRAKRLHKNTAQKLIIADTLLLGEEEIIKLTDSIIKNHYTQDNISTSQKAIQDASNTSYSKIIKKESEKLVFWGITFAGLADGVNPCAIATMIFLISFLATQKRPKKEVFIIGQSYILAVFLTYFLMGVSAFEALKQLKQYHYLSLIIRWSAIGLASYVSFYSFYDAYKYAKSGKNKDLKLQLSKSMKMRIHKVISGNLSQRGLITGAIITGFLVTLLEAVCTGQMYLPIIQGMTEREGTRFQGWLWLIYYNILFVLPLQVVMIASYKGITWDKLAKKTQKNMVLLKILLGIVMLLLVLYLLRYAV